MPLVSTPAIVLSALRYSETSKIVRLATREHGVQSAIAKGALRPKSRFGAALQLLSEGQAQYLTKEHRELHVLTAFDLQHLHVGLAADLERYATASALAEVMLRFAPPDPHPESFDVLRDALGSSEARAGAERGGARVPAALAAGERARVRAVARRLRASTALRCPERWPASVQHPRGRRPVRRLRRPARRHAAPGRGPGRSRRPARSRGARCPRSTTGTQPRTAGCWPATSATTWAKGPSCRRSSSGCGGPGWRHDHRNGRAHRPRQVRAGHRAHRPPDGPPGRGAAARDHDRSQLRAAGARQRRESPAIVDVPGHEDFVRTMVAGASGIDLALLVDRRRRRASCRRPRSTSRCSSIWASARGIPVVTKADLVEPDWLELVLLEVARAAGAAHRSPSRRRSRCRPEPGRGSTSSRAHRLRTPGEPSPARRAICSGCRSTGPSRSRGWERSSPAPPGRGESTVGDARASLLPSAAQRPGALDRELRPPARAERAGRAHRRRPRRGRRDEAPGGARGWSAAIAWAPTTALDVELTLEPRRPARSPRAPGFACTSARPK